MLVLCLNLLALLASGNRLCYVIIHHWPIILFYCRCDSIFISWMSWVRHMLSLIHDKFVYLSIIRNIQSPLTNKNSIIFQLVSFIFLSRFSFSQPCCYLNILIVFDWGFYNSFSKVRLTQAHGCYILFYAKSIGDFVLFALDMLDWKRKLTSKF